MSLYFGDKKKIADLHTRHVMCSVILKIHVQSKLARCDQVITFAVLQMSLLDSSNSMYDYGFAIVIIREIFSYLVDQCCKS